MPTRWLVAGEWEYEHYEAACAEGLRGAGVQVEEFAWAGQFTGLSGRVERWATAAGLATRRMRRALLAAAQRTDADVVLVWRGTHIDAATVHALKAGGRRRVIAYNNDDPFSPVYAQGTFAQRRLWHTFREAVPAYDVHFCYRPGNIGELRAAGAREVYLLMPWYVPGLDRPLLPSPVEAARWESDVVFIGHFENDGRREALLALCRAGVTVRLHGTGWGAAELGELAAFVGAVQPLRGDAYRMTLSSAKLALCFLSRLNRDRYTRRNFEIPACGTVLVTERTPELEAIFTDGIEAAFFSSTAELVSVVQALLANPARRAAIAAAGLHRVEAGGHSVHARMRQMLGLLQQDAA